MPIRRARIWPRPISRRRRMRVPPPRRVQPPPQLLRLLQPPVQATMFRLRHQIRKQPAIPRTTPFPHRMSAPIRVRTTTRPPCSSRFMPHSRLRRFRFMTSRLAPDQTTSGRQAIGTTSQPDITGCPVCGSSHPMSVHFGRRATGAGAITTMVGIMAIGVRTSAITAASTTATVMWAAATTAAIGTTTTSTTTGRSRT